MEKPDFKQLMGNYVQAINLLKGLELELNNSGLTFLGKSYKKRQIEQLKRKITFYQNKLINFGAEGNLYVVYGRYQSQSEFTPGLKITKEFKIYLLNVEKADILPILKSQVFVESGNLLEETISYKLISLKKVLPLN